ncbi:hypothetical protein H6P81_018806 [Aristolochia fimbriata]|uniref:DUF4378 domain-containing protein n=1 Tax=Aristolochia fimbriata TaxID=158543 RepID=A0AAV7E560_ARIFI|nr:hypothetical protein H6P81_018806 [Aristolochia fimbriata]
MFDGMRQRFQVKVLSGSNVGLQQSPQILMTSTSRKLLRHKKHSDGFEAPRNSLELPIEASQTYHGIHETVPCTYQVKQQSLKMNAYPSGGPIKKLIEEEITKQTSSKRNVPSVVARLMGMDMLPSDVKLLEPKHEGKKDNDRSNPPLMEQLDDGSIYQSALGSKPSKEMKQDLDVHGYWQDSNQSRPRQRLRKPQAREHPQEEELQKFKKEFEAWQAAKIWERSRSVELPNYPREFDNQILAQENLHKEKVARYLNINRDVAHGLSTKFKDRPQSGLHQDEHTAKTSQPIQKEVKLNARNRVKSDEREHIPFVDFDDKCSKETPKPTRIVILKPGPERVDEIEESQASSSEMEECSIENFLEEVKERLRLEIQGKGKRITIVRGSGVETPFSERPTDPKQIARHIAKQVRENVTRDLGMNLLRSESTRSCRSEVQTDGLDSPEFINRDTRKFLSNRLRNIIESATNVSDPSFVNGNTRTACLEGEGMRTRSITEFSKIGRKSNSWEDVKIEPETITRSFRHEEMRDEQFVNGGISPRNLVRSLSAPVSGTSFGKLLLEDPHVLTGAQIRRKLEATENVVVEVSKTRRQKFNFKGKVSNLKYSFTLRGRLFGKRIQSSGESGIDEADAFKAFMTVPTVLANLGNAQENSTEVPPSPASVCSSPYEDFFRPGDHPSPVSTLDVPFVEDHPIPQAFKEISSNLHELRRQLNQLQSDRAAEEGDVSEESALLEAESVNLESQAHIYIRDVLVAAGLYDGSVTLTKPIDIRVFKEVEDSYVKRSEEGETATKNNLDSEVNRKVLFDLLNEALLVLMKPPVGRSVFMRRVHGHIMVGPRGKKLLEAVWRMLHQHIYPPTDGCHSLDSTIACDLRMTHWSGMIQDEISEIGREVELLILGDLLEEVASEMCRIIV